MAIAKPTLSLPTGFETQQQQIASKRKIADAMLAQGLAPDDHMVNWAQVLGHWAQAWAGKSMQSDADKATGDLNSKILAAYTGAKTAFDADAKTMTPQQLREKYSSNQFLQDELKPYDEAFTAGLKNDQELVRDGSVWRKKGDIHSGQAITPDYNDAVIPDGNGNLTVNPVKVTAAIMAQGLPYKGKDFEYPTSMPMPQPNGAPTDYSKLTASMANGALPQAQPSTPPSGGFMTPDQYRAMSQSLGNGFSAWQQKYQTPVLVSGPEEMAQLPAGTIVVSPDGRRGVKK